MKKLLFCRFRDKNYRRILGVSALALLIPHGLSSQMRWYLDTGWERFEAGELPYHAPRTTLYLGEEEGIFVVYEEYYGDPPPLASGKAARDGDSWLLSIEEGEIPVGWTRDSRWRIATSEEHLFHTRYITNGNLIFWDIDTSVPGGARRSFDGVSVIRLEESSSDVPLLYNARARTGPGTDYDSLPLKGYWNQNDLAGGSAVTRTSLLADGYISIYPEARTTEKERIGDDDSYWYFCKIFIGDHPVATAYYGWIYGALLDGVE